MDVDAPRFQTRPDARLASVAAEELGILVHGDSGRFFTI